MPNPTASPHSTRLEYLSLEPQGAAFELEGRPVRLDTQGYAAPVASMQELYRHALADYYQRSAEMRREAGAARPPLLSRMLSWIGRACARLLPGSSVGTVPPPPPPPGAASASAAHHRPTEAGQPDGAQVPPSAVSARISGPHAPPPPAPALPTLATSAASPAGRAQKAEEGRRALPPPILQVVFADREGVHVIWQLAATKREPGAKRSDPAAAPARLELTYGLDSSMAQRLHDCYGQLAQLGYKVVGLEAARAAVEKPVRDKDKAEPVAVPAAPAPEPSSAENPAGSPAKAVESPAPRRPARPKPEPAAPRPDPARAPGAEPPNPSFLPGI